MLCDWLSCRSFPLRGYICRWATGLWQAIGFPEGLLAPTRQDSASLRVQPSVVTQATVTPRDWLSISAHAGGAAGSPGRGSLAGARVI